MSNQLKNTMSYVTIAINDAMSDAVKGEKRQAKLVDYIYHQASAQFTSDNIIEKLRKHGTDRTDAFNTMCASLSDDYAKALKDIATHEEELKKNKTNKTKCESINSARTLLVNKAKAARVMMERTLECVIHLRQINPTLVKLTDTGRIKVVAKSKDGIPETSEYSGRELTSEAKDTVEQVAPKKAKAQRAAGDTERSPREKARKDSLTITANYLRTTLKPHDTLDEDTFKAFEDLTAIAMIRMFCDDNGTVDVATVKDFIAKNVKPMTAAEAEARQVANAAAKDATKKAQKTAKPSKPQPIKSESISLADLDNTKVA